MLAMVLIFFITSGILKPAPICFLIIHPLKPHPFPIVVFTNITFICNSQPPPPPIQLYSHLYISFIVFAKGVYIISYET
jgi:hypothetical protein